MKPLKRKTRLSLSSLTLLTAVLTPCIFPTLALASASTSAPQDASDRSRSEEMICRTENQADCYPAVFRPTHEFQTVHDDQELPPGLHVRLNIYTGVKEAKINDPDEVLPEVDGLATEQAMVVVEPEQPEKPKIPKDAPKYEAVGKIKEPGKETEAGHAGISFAGAKATVKDAFESRKPETAELNDALGRLEDLSHDMYYGLEIAKDTDFVKNLLCTMSSGDPSADTDLALQAAAILSGSLSNNPAATKKVDEAWPSIMQHECASDNSPLRERFYSSLVLTSGENPSGRAKMRVAAIAHLLRSKAFKKDYLASEGMSQLLEVLIPEGKEWTAAKRRVALLVLDTFLDADMGAETGLWPQVPRLPDDQCEGSKDEGCWDFHAAKMVEANQGDWSKSLQDGLATARKEDTAAAGDKHTEL